MFKRISLILLMLVLTVSWTGCVSLRKKFVRKSKAEQEPQVYVDFKEYPNKPSVDAYRDYLMFTSGWLDELQQALEKKVSLKRERRAINEAIMNVEQIASFFNKAGQEKITPVYKEMLQLRLDIERNSNSNEIENNRLAKKAEKLKLQLQSEFSFSDAQQWMN